MTPSPTPSLDGEAGEASLRKLLTDAADWVESVHDGEWPYHPFTRDDLVDRLRAAIPALPPDTGKQAVAEIQRLKDALNVIGDWAHDRSTGPTVPDDLWEVRRMAYESMDTPLAASQPDLDTGKQAENVYDLIPPSAAEWFANSPGIANHDWRGGWDACRNRARTLVEEYRAASKADERMRHDYPILQQFHTRHALGAMAAPSCLCCGHQTHPITRAIAVQHMELPAMVVCQQCKAAASQPAPTPDAAQQIAAWLRSDGMKAMPADEKDAWIEAGEPEIAADYTIPLYRAASMQDTSSPQSPQGGA